MKLADKAVIFPVVICIITIALMFFSCNKDSDPKVTTIVKCISCANGGSCVNDTCRCPSGYEGSNCETITRDKYLGNWTVLEKGSITGAAQYQVSIEAANAVTQITIVNFNNFFTVPILASVNGDTIKILNQQYDGKVMFGTGYIYSSVAYGQYGSIQMSYEVADSATSLVDDYGYYSSIDLSQPSVWNK